MKILDYFSIEGSFGGNQDWLTNVVMHIGGCGAATACDSCIYFAKYLGMESLYPYDIHKLTRDDYKRFSQMMKPYIRPRAGGVRKLEWYMEGFRKYLDDVNKKENSGQIEIQMEGFAGSNSYKDSARVIRRQIDAGIPVPYLMLKHQNEAKFKDFIWHWFLVVGYKETEEGVQIIAATYGERVTLPLKELWNTGYEEKGGMIIYHCQTSGNHL